MTTDIEFTKTKIHEEVTKVIYQTEDSFTLLQSFKDKLVGGLHSIDVPGIGAFNNNLSAFLMGSLCDIGIKTHFIEKINMKEQIVHALDTIPIKLSISNVAFEDYAKMFGISTGQRLATPDITYSIIGSDFPVNEMQIRNNDLVSEEDLEFMIHLGLKINSFLYGFFLSINIRVIDCSLQFGKMIHLEDYNDIVLADVLSLENCKFLDLDSSEYFGNRCAFPDKLSMNGFLSKIHNTITANKNHSK